jgi:hypothetical protein
MVRFKRIFGDRVVSFGFILVPISHLNKHPLGALAFGRFHATLAIVSSYE